MAKRQKKVSVGAKVTAKLEAVARASYQRKKTTTEIIPSDVSRAKAAAWLNLISPITQWAGLKGDGLRYKRDLLRIQQESTLEKVIARAMDQLNRARAPISPLPNKFLVPFLERASLEDDTSDLSERWSDLLVSAATEYTPSMVRFASVLSEIGPGEAALLKKMVVERQGKRKINHIEDVPHIFIHGILQRMIVVGCPESDDPEQLYSNIIDKFEYPGTAWPYVGVWDDDGGYWDFESSWFVREDEELASTLVSVGVLHLLDGLEGKLGNREWNGRVYALTSFGLRFLLACDRQVHNELKAYNRTMEELELAAERELNKNSKK